MPAVITGAAALAEVVTRHGPAIPTAPIQILFQLPQPTSRRTLLWILS